MRYLKAFLFLGILLIIQNKFSFSQGCSDAGVCTINTIKDHSFDILEQDKNKNHFSTGITYGLGDHDIKVTNPYVEYKNNLTDELSIAGKLTYAFINGELANTNNLSDFIITANRYIYNRDLSSLTLTLGGKIPLNNANIKTEDENALPMNYQTSLGTYDLIIGLNYLYMDFGVSMALQQPVINANDNEFIAPTNPSQEEAKYQSTNSFDRKGDLIGRISYNVDIIETKFIIRPSLLAIYHLSNDSFVDQANNEQQIDGSQGLTLNANVFVSYYFANNKQVELAFGMPFVTRDSRPDGLTREWVLGIEYSFSF